jgi:hypothetical protein
MTVLEFRQVKCGVEVTEGGEVVHMLHSKYFVEICVKSSSVIQHCSTSETGTLAFICMWCFNDVMLLCKTFLYTFGYSVFFNVMWQERIEEGDEIEMQIESEGEEEDEEEEEGEEEDKRGEERPEEEDQEAREAKDNTQVIKCRCLCNEWHSDLEDT